MSAHTRHLHYDAPSAAPWTWSVGDDGTPGAEYMVSITDGNCEPVIYGECLNYPYDAPLLAAAPAMYAACEAVLALEPHMALCEVGEDCATCRDLTFRAQDLAEAAIRNVRGEQP